MSTSSMSESVAKLIPALSKFQGTVKTPPKNRSVTVQPRDHSKGSYTFSYAELSTIIEHVQKPMMENELAWTSWIEGGDRGPLLVTRLFHSSGEWIQTIYMLPNTNDPKAFAGEITYGRRYSLTMLLGLASEADADEMPPSQPKADQSKGKTHAKPSQGTRAPGPDVRPRPGPENAPEPKTAASATGSPPVQGNLEGHPTIAGPGPRRAGAGERKHIVDLCKKFGWEHHEVQSYIKKRFGAGAVTELFMPQYNELAAVLAAHSFDDAMQGILAEGGGA